MNNLQPTPSAKTIILTLLIAISAVMIIFALASSNSFVAQFIDLILVVLAFVMVIGVALLYLYKHQKDLSK